MKKSDENIRIEFGKKNDWGRAVDLAWDVFCEASADQMYEDAPYYFHKFIYDPMMKKLYEQGSVQLIVAKLESKGRVLPINSDEIIGMLATKGSSHVSLFFVKKEYRNRGIGSALMDMLEYYAKAEEGADYLTVNAAIGAKDFYLKRGYNDVSETKTLNGIIFTPMELLL